MPKGIPRLGYRRSPTRALAFRLDAAYTPEPNTGCWLWNRSCSGDGYGRVRYNRRQVGAHRLFYELAKGAIPPGLTIDHLCRVITCVNPDHMEVVPIRVNTLRGTSPIAENARKTRCKRGHEFTPENTFVPHQGGRQCAACRDEYFRHYHKRKSA